MYMFLFITKKAFERKVMDMLEEGRKSFISDFSLWHKSKKNEQERLQQEFKLNTLNMISILVNKDFCHTEGKTFAYIENDEIPQDTCFDILFDMVCDIKRSLSVENSLHVSLELYDSSIEKPSLIGHKNEDYGMVRRWQITFKNVHEGDCKIIKDAMISVSHFNKIPIKVSLVS